MRVKNEKNKFSVTILINLRVLIKTAGINKVSVVMGFIIFYDSAGTI